MLMPFRKRAWHVSEPKRPAWVRLLRGLATAVLGIGLPLALLIAFLTANTPKPPDQPDAPSLDTTRGGVEADAPVDGRWDLAADGRSWVGYRIDEELPRLYGTFEAVGRTRVVSGHLAVEGLTVTEGVVSADLRELTSDRDWRDRVIRRRYLESNDHPEARFELTEPFGLIAEPAIGERVVVPVDGTLTIRSITRPVRVSLEAQRGEDSLRIVGSIPVVLADFEVQPPRIGGFRIVDDEGVVELDLTFVRGD